MLPLRWVAAGDIRHYYTFILDLIHPRRDAGDKGMIRYGPLSTLTVPFILVLQTSTKGLSFRICFGRALWILALNCSLDKGLRVETPPRPAFLAPNFSIEDRGD